MSNDLQGYIQEFNSLLQKMRQESSQAATRSENARVLRILAGALPEAFSKEQLIDMIRIPDATGIK